MMAFLAVGLGAMLGAWMRWGLGLWLNPLFPSVPLGTLAANVAGGYVIGLALAWFAEHPGVPPEARLFFITGVLGGLTTFSTFSAEVVGAWMRGLWGTGALIALLHLAGSLSATALGFLTLRGLR